MVSSGAGSSKGRTSWTAKPELSDYISFAGFFVYYVAGLNPAVISQPAERSQCIPSSPLSPIQSAVASQGDRNAGFEERMVLILGGYSYGSLITSNLPSTETILSSFATVSKGTAEAEIRLRAMNLSNQSNAEAQQHPRRGRRSAQSALRASPHSAVFGGEESEPGTRRPSRESRRSIDMVRRSMDRSRTKLGIRRSSSEVEPAPLEVKLGKTDLVQPSTHYLLISPLLPPISMLATMFSKANVFRNDNIHPTQPTTTPSASCAEEKFRRHPTLAIYGDKDFFTSHKKLRKWAEQLMAESESRFTCREIQRAGHFWREEGVDGQMRGCIRDWVVDIVGRQAMRS
ncbi:hypothetical protein MMC30_008407 [Trapelia coarctata]|nr:hypothetical protein [Trapelia coarctata]